MNLLGKTLGNYKIDRLLGAGGMGTVYHARDIILQREVAIKLIHPHLARQPSFRERFIKEARIMAQLNHPGIVPVYHMGVDQDLLYLPMKFIDGGNLRQLLDELVRQGKCIPVQEAILLLQQLCEVVEYAHQHGVLHRDIKPANLMLDPEPVGKLPFRIILTDLGLAKLLEELGMTQEGTTVGTPAYMSPEQAEGKLTDRRSDVYSLGILLYELAAGRLPFAVHTISEALRYHTQVAPPAPSSINADVPQSLERVILKALEKDPARRYASAAALSLALETSLDVSTQIAEPTDSQDTSLLTVYEKSVLAPPKPASSGSGTIFDTGSQPPRGASVFEGKSVPPGAGARIQIQHKDTTARVVSLPAGQVTIGRDPDNSIVINDNKVSGHHLQIMWDGMEYHVTDLSSRNGTHIDNTPLLPGVSERWRPDQVLRIGDTWLRLIPPAASIPSGSGVVSHAGRSSLFTTSSAGLVGVSVTPQQLTVEPGGSVTAAVSLLNQSRNVDHFSLTVTGISSTWVANLPSGIQLMPGEQKQETLVFQVPRSPQNRAGPYPVTLRVNSVTDSSQYVDHKLTLIVKPYAQFKIDVHPKRLRVGQDGHVTVYNQGNLQGSYTGKFTDFADELTFHPPQFHLSIPEGGSATQEFRASPRSPKWLGGETVHPYTAQISPADGEPQTLQAEVTSKAYIPAWVPPTLLPVCLLLAGALIWGLSALLSPAPVDTPTSLPSLAFTPTPLPPGVPTLTMTETPTPTLTPTPPLTGTATITATIMPTMTPTMTATNTQAPTTQAPTTQAPTTAAPALVEIALNSLSAEAGYVTSSGTVFPFPNVGDLSDNGTAQAFVAFDMTTIPAGSTITKVVVNFSDYDTLGNPWGISDGCLRAYVHDYGTVDASDFFIGDPLGAVLRWCSPSELSSTFEYPELKSVVQSVVGTSRLRLRLQFRVPTTNSNGTADMVRFGNGIQLIITYE